jgi:hypothetical protein
MAVPPVHRAAPERADKAEVDVGASSLIDTMRRCLQPLAFAAAWVFAGTLLVALLALLGGALTR